MEFVSFLASLGVSFLVFAVLMLVFSWSQRKPCNAVICYPNQILRSLDPLEGRRRRTTTNSLVWIKGAARAPEADTVAAAGVDAAVYLVFLNSALKILVFSGIVLLPVLLPLAGTDELLKSVADDNGDFTFTNLNKLGMGNVQNRSPRLWACLLGVYWVSFVTYYMLWKACIHVMELRATAIASPGVRPEEFTVLVRDIPPALADQTMKEHVDSYFSALHGNKQVNKIWKVIEEYRKKLARAEGVLAESARRHTCRTGFLGVVGEKVDTIDPCNKKIKELLPKFEAEQQITLREKQEAAALVFFNSRAAAVSASQTIRAQKTGTWTVTEAAEPRQLLWANLPQNCSQRRTRSSVIHGIVFLTVCFFTIPVAIVGLLANYNYPAAVWAGLGAFLPQVLLVAFFALLSRFLMFLSKKEGLPFESQAVRAAIKRHFCFVVFDVFLGFTVWGTFLDALQGFIDQPSDQFMPLLGLSVPRNSNFFITFIALKFFICNGLEISRLFPLIIFHFKKKFIRKTEAEVPPGDLGYASRLPSDMLVITLVLCYSVAAPMIIPFGAVYFGLGWLITKNQVLRVYIPKYESKGSLWPDMYAWVVATVIIYQACMIGYVVAWKFYFAFLLTPLILISLSYAYLFEKRLELKEARGGQRV